MSSCPTCPVKDDCYYWFKPCDCVHQRKFMTREERAAWELKQTHINGAVELETLPMPQFLRKGTD